MYSYIHIQYMWILWCSTGKKTQVQVQDKAKIIKQKMFTLFPSYYILCGVIVFSLQVLNSEWQRHCPRVLSDSLFSLFWR